MSLRPIVALPSADTPLSGNLTDRMLQCPSYGWTDEEKHLMVPTRSQLFGEFFRRLNIFQCRRNWLSFFNWFKVVALLPFLFFFFYKYFNFYFLGLAFLYSMVAMGTHGTIWFHRYCTHKAYTFRNKFWRFVTRNLTINMIVEETYVISHHVHHAKSDQPGDPYNASAGFLYCFLADVNHQPINKTLSQEDYARVAALLKHAGTRANSYRQYQKWGSIAHPALTLITWLGNWLFWATVFYLLGGVGLVCALFGSAAIWAIGVRTFNYEGHGRGEDKQRDGTDFHKKDLSINQWWPGWVAGEWHNNHHLFPTSARTGFLRYQLDLAWCYIKLMHLIGAVSSYQDAKQTFLRRHHQPWLAAKPQR